jgi:hypothetical protein
MRFWLGLVAATLTLILAAAPAHAQATRTWVSGVGDDVNPCSRTAPCKTFAGAISKTAAAGEINCLDPGGFGAVTIIKSMTIDCAGTLGSTLASGTNGIVVNGAGIIVNLRNLTINGTGTIPGTNGVRILQASQVNIEDVNIMNFRGAAPNGFGITILPNGALIRVYVRDSTINGNGTATSGAGINIQPTGGQAEIVLSGVELINNFRGIQINATGTAAGNSVTVVNSRIFGSADNAIDVSTNANAMNLMIEGTTIANNRRGLVLVGAGSATRIGNSVVASNGTAFAPSAGAVLQSYRNNQIDFNSANGTPLPQATLN